MFKAKDMFEVFQKYRGDAIVVPTGTSGRRWREVSTNEKRDVALGGALGHTPSAVFGLTMAQPDVKVVFFDSEGALLMNLGILETIAGKQPKNFYHFLMDNECYATTGGQPVPNAENISYASIARGAGYAATYEFEELEDFANNLESILSQPGPVFIAMKITPEIENEPIGRRTRVAVRTRDQVIKDLREELGVAG